MRAPPPLAGPLPGGDAVYGLSIAALQDAMAAGTLRATDLVRGYLARIAAFDRNGPALNAVLALDERALDEAAGHDAARRRGEAGGPLRGIPLLLKDNIDTAGLPTTGGSIALARRLPRRDAEVVRRLRAAGAVILGKVTMHELACGITNVSSLSGRTRNAFDAGRVPGGSSGGSAVAVASGFAAAAIGTDTSGSIRIPAAFNQVLGLRPTAGACSTQGVLPLSPTMDAVGPMARSVADLSILWAAMAGPMPAGDREAMAEPALAGDRETMAEPMSAGGGASRATGGWRIGTVDALFGDAPEEWRVSAAARGALARWLASDAGAAAGVAPAGLAVTDARLAAANVTNYEFRDALAACLRDEPDLPVRDLAGILDGGYAHPEVEAILRQREAARDPGGHGRAAALASARAIRADVLDAMARGGFDMLAYPSVRRGPVPLGQPQTGGNGLLAAVTGLPALSVPIGFTEAAEPVGLELLGPPGGESLLMRAAAALLRAVRA